MRSRARVERSGGFPHSLAAGVTIDVLHRSYDPSPPFRQQVIEERTVTLRYSRGPPSHHTVRITTHREYKSTYNFLTFKHTTTTQAFKAYEPPRHSPNNPPLPQSPAPSSANPSPTTPNPSPTTPIPSPDPPSPKAEWTAPMYQLDAFARCVRNPPPPAPGDSREPGGVPGGGGGPRHEPPWVSVTDATGLVKMMEDAFWAAGIVPEAAGVFREGGYEEGVVREGGLRMVPVPLSLPLSRARLRGGGGSGMEERLSVVAEKAEGSSQSPAQRSTRRDGWIQRRESKEEGEEVVVMSREELPVVAEAEGSQGSARGDGWIQRHGPEGEG